MSEERDELEAYPVLMEFRASVRRPRLLMSGNVVELFLDKLGPYADAALVLGQGKYHDAEVAVTLRLMKHPDGRDAAEPRPKPPPPERSRERQPGEDDEVPFP